MSSFLLITMGRPFDVFDENGRLVSQGQRRLVVPFDDDGAFAAFSEAAIVPHRGLPPGFAHIATHVVEGEVIPDGVDQ